MLKYQKQPLICNFALRIDSVDMLNIISTYPMDFFESIELSFDLFDDFIATLQSKFDHFSNLKNVIIDMNINQALINNIVSQTKAIKDNFCYELANQLDQLPSKFNKIVLKFDFDEAMRNKQYSNNLHKLLKNIISLTSIKRQIIIPLTIPANDNNVFNFAHNFVKNFELPLMLSLDISPQKLINEQSDYLAYFQTLKYYFSLVTITYDHSFTQRLKKKNLIPIIEELQSQQYSETISLAVANTNKDELENIISKYQSNFSKVLTELNTKNCL
ncbi:hypothetical protein AAEX28_03725 [Lentisphaerota bacterium WC36G]|nr:hypothetical protein LJT99_06600 [Lentisphaerae bacterium WC36]